MPAKGRPKGAKARYKEIASQLELEIREGVWRVGAALPSRGQLCARYGVSATVIRNTLRNLADRRVILPISNQKWSVAPQEIEVSSRANLVALVLAHALEFQWTRYSYSQIHRGIEMAIAREQDPLLMIHGNTSVLRNHVPPNLKAEMLRGILLIGPFTRECIAEYAHLGVPTVLIDQPSSHEGVLSVCADNSEAVQEAMRRVYDLGHRRIAFCRRIRYNIVDIDGDSRERQAAYQKSAEKIGLNAKDLGTFSFFPDGDSNRRTLKNLFSSRKPFTAALAVDPEIGAFIAKAARNLGRVVGRDISIVCFNALGAQDLWAGPCIDFEKMGGDAVGMLMSERGTTKVRRIPVIWKDGTSLGKAPSLSGDVC